MGNLFFLHGLEGSSKGVKSQFLKKHYPDCIIHDFPADLLQRLTILKESVGENASWLIGSSLGGLHALFFAQQYPELVKGMILIAPAVGFYDSSSWCSEDELSKINQLVIPVNIPCTILAGLDDEIIPLMAIESLISRSPKQSSIKLIKLKDDHHLNKSLHILFNEIKAMISDP